MRAKPERPSLTRTKCGFKVLSGTWVKQIIGGDDALANLISPEPAPEDKHPPG